MSFIISAIEKLVGKNHFSYERRVCLAIENKHADHILMYMYVGEIIIEI